MNRSANVFIWISVKFWKEMYRIHPLVRTRERPDILFEFSKYRKLRKNQEFWEFGRISSFKHTFLQALKIIFNCCLRFSANFWSIMKQSFYQNKENFCMVSIIWKSSFLSRQYTGSSSVLIGLLLSFLTSLVFNSSATISAEGGGCTVRTSASMFSEKRFGWTKPRSLLPVP